ncbi:hypothetical protein FOCC_FOCC008822 [Frankliniella occidentalis]|nr:hypothetical protein FOCC_FOCC008822 [Frankliniella occidentalis]
MAHAQALRLDDRGAGHRPRPCHAPWLLNLNHVMSLPPDHTQGQTPHELRQPGRDRDQPADRHGPAVLHHHHDGRRRLLALRGLVLLRLVLLLLRHAHYHRLWRLRRPAERPGAHQQPGVRRAEPGLHPVRAGRGGCQHKLARAALHGHQRGGRAARRGGADELLAPRHDPGRRHHGAQRQAAVDPRRHARGGRALPRAPGGAGPGVGVLVQLPGPPAVAALRAALQHPHALPGPAPAARGPAHRPRAQHRLRHRAHLQGRVLAARRDPGGPLGLGDGPVLPQALHVKHPRPARPKELVLPRLRLLKRAGPAAPNAVICRRLTVVL